MENKAFLDDLDDELSNHTGSRFKASQPSLFDAIDPFSAAAAIPPMQIGIPKGKGVDHSLHGPMSVVYNDPDKTEYELVPAPKPKPIIGADILAIRELTGKKKENAVKALHNAAVQMLKDADAGCYYIPGNTASSKNNKEIGRFKKRNKATGKLEDFTTLVDSKITQKYRKETAGYWLQNKVAFLNETRHMPLPLQVEFTFIRESLRRSDFVNMGQILCDMMSEYGWIPDDESAYIVPVFNRVVYYSKELAGVLIRVIH